MNKNRKNIGELGENIACEYLVKNGWKMLARNYREKFDEIDIIARSNDGILVFCEVKTLLRSDVVISGSLMPEDNLTSQKLHKISRACQIFVGKHPELVDSIKGWRIDLLAIDLAHDGKIKDIRHYENI